MNDRMSDCHIYEGPGDDLAGQMDGENRIVLMPDAPTLQREPDTVEHIRILWGQRLIDDLVGCRYRSFVCAVNASDNSHGIINLLARRLPSSQWDENMITQHARRFVQPHRVTVVKFDMDPVEVLALLRPSEHDHLSIEDLAAGFRILSAMLRSHPQRMPTASCCFLGARANKLLDPSGHEPSFERILHVMYDGGFRGDVYPAPWMWESAPTAVFPRYPFPESFKQMCGGGY